MTKPKTKRKRILTTVIIASSNIKNVGRYRPRISTKFNPLFRATKAIRKTRSLISN